MRAKQKDAGKQIHRYEHTLRLAGLTVHAHEIRALALVCAVIGTGGTVVGFAVMGILGLSPLAVMPLLVLPLVLYLSVVAYPDLRAERVREETLPQLPALLGYLRMCLRVHPSLERGISFAADHLEGAFAARLRRVLWEVHFRVRTRPESAFLEVGAEFAAFAPELKRALRTIVAAVQEGSAEALLRGLDRGSSIIREGARRRCVERGARLRTATSALFALGVLLPLMIGSMLPLLSVGAIVPSALDSQQAAPANPYPWFLLLDVAFPAMTFILAHYASSGQIANPSHREGRALAGVALIPICLLLGFPFGNPSTMLLFLGGGIVAASGVLIISSRVSVRLQREAVRLEQTVPDVLFHAATRLKEGEGLEFALLGAADDFVGTPAGDLVTRAAHRMRLGESAEEAFFGDSGVAIGLRSRRVRASLRMLVDSAVKDPENAGEAILDTSAHLRDLESLEEDLRGQLQPTVDSIRGTALMFGPVLLGVTVGLYELLAKTYVGIGPLPMTAAEFSIATAVYAISLTAALAYFLHRIDRRCTPLAARLGGMLPISFGVFLSAVIAARTLI